MIIYDNLRLIFDNSRLRKQNNITSHYPLLITKVSQANYFT